MMTQEAPEENKYISTGYWGVALEKFVDPSKTVCVVWRPFCPKGIPRVRVINCEENKEFNNRDELQAFIAKLNLAADQAWPQITKEPMARKYGKMKTSKAQDLINKANGGIIGIDADLQVYGGYDNAFESASMDRPEWIFEDEWVEMPSSEKIILADRMIALWSKYKEAWDETKETGMKLIDELQGVERDNALISGEWPNTLKRLSDLMRQRASAGGYGALHVGVHSKQVEMMLREWATGEGLNVQEGGGMFTRAIWLVWGIAPVMSCGCDVEVMTNGKLVIHER